MLYKIKKLLGLVKYANLSDENDFYNAVVKQGVR